MKQSKVLGAVLGLSLLLGSTGIALAYTPISYHFDYSDSGGPSDTNLSSTAPDNGDVFGTDPTTGELRLLPVGPGLINTGTGLQVSTIVADKIIIPDGDPLGYWFTNVLPLDYISTTTFSGFSGSMTSTINSLGSSVLSINTLNSQINANLFGTSTTMTAQAASTTNGLMTQAQSDKLDAMSANLPWSWGTTTRSIVTGTGATGFQVSSSRVSSLHYNVKVTTTASIAGNADGYVTLEVAPTNSATASDWVEMGRCGNSQALTLAITLQSVQGTTCELVGDVPAGYYSKLRSVTTTGTVTYAFVSSSEVLK